MGAGRRPLKSRSRSDESQGARGSSGGGLPIACSNPTCVRLSVAALLTILLLAGCAGRAWKQAVREDSAASYHRFLRDHPGSKYATEAQERIDFLKLERDPSLEAFQAFQDRYPQSRLADRLQEKLERATFEQARATGSPAAYEEFVQAFPSSEQAPRAEGNAVYLREVAGRPDPDRLRAFASEHPASDFAPEAMRTAEVFAARTGTEIRSVGLVIETQPDAVEARRVVQAFVEKATETYQLAGTRLVPLKSVSQAAAAGVDAVLSVRHVQEARANVMAEGLLPQPGVLATTRVELQRGDEMIFDRAFELRVEDRQVTSGRSVLFGAAGPRFWNEFFVPVATWDAHRAVRQPVSLSSDAVAVDATGDRAVVLYETGAFEVLQLADPAAPVRLAAYERGTPLERFGGVRVLPTGVAIFGDDGLELVGVAEDGSQRVVTRGRGEIGSVSALEPLGDQLVLGGGGGLLVLPGSGLGDPEVVTRRAVRGLARAADLLVFADGDTLFVSTLGLLRQKRVMGQLKVGKAFATRRIRVFGTTALVIGDGGVIVVDLRSPRMLRMIGRLRPDRVGAIADAGRVGSRIFLVGERGVQVLGPRLDRIVEVVDAVPGQGIASFGRHLVAVGGPQLQVIDGLPFASGPDMAARPAKSQ